MNGQEFWQLIAKIDWEKEENDERLEPVIEVLSRKSVEEIYEFDSVLAQKLYELDGQVYAENLAPEDAYGAQEGYFSNDYFLYARCCVVANGQEYFENVKANPEQMPKGLDYEPLLYVGLEAFKRKTGKTDDDFFANWNLPVSYETFSNEEKWK